jgi:FkbM family methyltransferase
LASLNSNHRLIVGSSSWLLKEAKGANLFDKIVLTSLKIMYLGARVLIRIALGKKGRDKFYIDKKINFNDFLYNSIELLKLDKSLLLVFEAPKYNYRFCSRITRKVENFLINDMYASMSSHEDDVLQYFSPKEGEVVIDVGAAFGFYTLISSIKVGTRGRIIAIEAQPDSFKMLNRNIKLNRLDNVITLNYAAYSSKAKLKLYRDYSLIRERISENTQKFVEVKADILDHLLSEYMQAKEVNWIKIDVEGAELQVLEGARSILSNSKNIQLLIEIHGQNNYESVTKFLNSYNFKIDIEKTYAGGDRHIIFRKYPTKNE